MYLPALGNLNVVVYLWALPVHIITSQGDPWNFDEGAARRLLGGASSKAGGSRIDEYDLNLNLNLSLPGAELIGAQVEKRGGGFCCFLVA